MRTIETTVVINEDGQLVLQLPKEIVPGRHRVVIVIDERVERNDGGCASDIDAAFADMAHDSEYQREVAQIEEEFAVAQWEAFREAEAG